MTDTPKRRFTKQDEKRALAKQTTDFARTTAERERRERAEKTERLKAMRLAQQQEH